MSKKAYADVNEKAFGWRCVAEILGLLPEYVAIGLMAIFGLNDGRFTIVGTVVVNAIVVVAIVGLWLSLKSKANKREQIARILGVKEEIKTTAQVVVTLIILCVLSCILVIAWLEAFEFISYGDRGRFTSICCCVVLCALAFTAYARGKSNVYYELLGWVNLQEPITENTVVTEKQVVKK